MTSSIRQTYAALAAGGTHQVATLHGWRSFFESLAHARGADRPEQTAYHQGIRQPLHGPVAATLGGLAASRRDQWLLQVSLILIVSGRGGCGLGWKAAWNPAVTNRWRTRAMGRGPVPQAATRASSSCALPDRASANRRMRAGVSVRAAAVPTATRPSSSTRSSGVQVTRYLSI